MNPLRGIAVFLAAAFIQWWWSTHFSFGGLSPQVLLVLTVVLAARLGQNLGMCYGFFWGLFLDAMHPQLFGADALVLMLAGYGVGILRRQIDLADILPLSMVVFLATWLYFLAQGLVSLAFARTFLWIGWRPWVADPFYNCLFVPAAAVCWEWTRAQR